MFQLNIIESGKYVGRRGHQPLADDEDHLLQYSPPNPTLKFNYFLLNYLLICLTQGRANTGSISIIAGTRLISMTTFLALRKLTSFGNLFAIFIIIQL